MALQIAKNEGAIVTSVCSSKKFAFAKSLRSDKFIDYILRNAELKLDTYKQIIDVVEKTVNFGGYI
jgi:NADPH:quinone reductase-like Zn-dependent oxidoreductase